MTIKMAFRSAAFTVRACGEGEDAEKRVRVSVSSEEPVPQMVWDDSERDGDGDWVYALEVLGHGEDEIDRSRMADGLVIQDTHAGDQIGIIREPEVVDGKLGGEIEFGCGPRAQEIKADAERGIRRNMSVGYLVNKWKRMEDVDGWRVYRAVRWTPYEASFVNVPADTRVGVGRAFEIKAEQPSAKLKEVSIMETKNERAELTAKDVSEMYRLARAASLEVGAVDAFVKEGKSIEEFREIALGAIEKNAAARAAKPEMPKAELGRAFDEKDMAKVRSEYSLHRAILSLDPNSHVDANFEREISREIEKQTGRRAQGIFVPHCLNAKRDITQGHFYKGDGNGSKIVATETLFGEFIEALQERLVLAKAGVRVLSGLTGDIAIPKSGKMTGGWVSAEGGDASASTPTLGQVTGTPHTASAYTDISRKLLLQSGIPAEALTTDLLINAVARLVEDAAFNGTGESGAPTGIVNASGINTVSFTAGAPTLKKLCDMVAAIESDSADFEGQAWIGRPSVKALLRTTLDYTNIQSPETTVGGVTSGKYLLDQFNGEAFVEGMPFYTSMLAPATGLLFGAWNQLMLALWSGTDITVDPYSLSKSGSLRVVALQDCDVLCRHGEAFAKGTTVISA